MLFTQCPDLRFRFHHISTKMHSRQIVSVWVVTKALN